MDNYIINLADFQLTQKDFFIRLFVAVGIGFLIGLEREYSSVSNKIQSFAGIRTFTFVVLLGFIGVMMNYLMSPWVYAGILMAVIIFIGISYWITSFKGDIGGTTEFSALIAFFLGSLSFLGYIELSLVITVIVVVLLSAKVRFKYIVGKITQREMYDFIRFIVAALLIFPFLPDEPMGPFDVLNPREIGWVILLISGLGFLGYLLMKFLGANRGILLTGIVGGLVSSTMVTWVFAKKSKELPALSINCATAILAASSIMVIRVLLWVYIFNKSLLQGLLLPVGIIFLAAIGVTFYFYKKQTSIQKMDAPLPGSKPLDIQSAVTFGFIYTLILLLVSYTSEYFGNSGILISSVIAGLTDIDAITISVSKLTNVSLTMNVAQNAILLATISNTLVKIGIAIWAGSKELRKHIFIGYGIIFLAAIIAFAILNF